MGGGGGCGVNDELVVADDVAPAPAPAPVSVGVDAKLKAELVVAFADDGVWLLLAADAVVVGVDGVAPTPAVCCCDVGWIGGICDDDDDDVGVVAAVDDILVCFSSSCIFVLFYSFVLLASTILFNSIGLGLIFGFQILMKSIWISCWFWMSSSFDF